MLTAVVACAPRTRPSAFSQNRLRLLESTVRVRSAETPPANLGERSTCSRIDWEHTKRRPHEHGTRLDWRVLPLFCLDSDRTSSEDVKCCAYDRGAILAAGVSEGGSTREAMKSLVTASTPRRSVLWLRCSLPPFLLASERWLPPSTRWPVRATFSLGAG